MKIIDKAKSIAISKQGVKQTLNHFDNNSEFTHPKMESSTLLNTKLPLVQEKNSDLFLNGFVK